MKSGIVIALTLMTATPAAAQSADPDNKDFGVVTIIKEIGKAMFGGGFSKVRAVQSAMGQGLPLTNDKAGKTPAGQILHSRQIESKPSNT